MAGTPGVTYALGAWWYNNVAYGTQEQAQAAASSGVDADSQADFNSATIAQVPTYLAPPDNGRLQAARDLRANQERLASVPYGTSAFEGGTANDYQVTTAPTIGTGAIRDMTVQQTNREGAPVIGGVNNRTITQVGGALPAGQGQVVRRNTQGTIPATATGAQGQVAVPPSLAGSNPQLAGGGAPRADQSAADEQRTQQRMLIARLVEEAGRSQASPVVDQSGYNQSREQSNATYSALGALAGNNIGPINASTGQRDDSRGQLLGTADRLTSNASNNIGSVAVDASQRNTDRSQVDQFLGGLQASSRNDVGDVMIDAGRYDQGRSTTADLIQRLIAEAERPEGPSEAEALMLSAQERAQRNAMGDATNTAGGWRSQLVAQRRADGLGAQMSADAAAQMGALRAREETQYRSDVRDALLGAGGLQGASSAQDLQLGISDADRTAQIRQGNQTNTRESLAAAAAQANAKLTSDTGFATSNADRLADIAKADQLNALNSLLGAGGLQSNALTSDTGFATDNANRQERVSIANQSNSLAAQIAASQNAQQRLESDRALATDNANRVERVNTANADRAINALTQAGVISSGTRQIDAQLSQGDQRAILEMAIASAGADVQKYSAQLQYALGMANVEQRKQELARLKAQDPGTFERIMGVVGQIPALAAMF